MVTLTHNDLYEFTISDRKFYLNNEKGHKHLQKVEIQHPLVRGFDHFIVLDEMVISHKNWVISQPIKMAIQHDKPLLKCQFEIIGHSLYTPVERNETIAIHSNHCHFFYLPAVSGDVLYPKSREVLDIMISPDYLLQLITEEDLDTASFAKALLNRQPFRFFSQDRIISARYISLINNILQQPYSGSFARSYVQCKATELIIMLLKDSDLAIPKTHPFLSKNDVLILHHIKQNIASDPAANYSLLGLARQFGINDFKLKKGFKSLFEMTVFSFILEQRMMLCLHLINNTDLNLGEISQKVGFKHQHHFTQRFKSYFGFLPSSYSKGVAI